MTRLPVTGLGIIAPGAIGVDAFRQLLDSGTSAVSDVDRFDTVGLGAHKAALVRDFAARDYIPVMKIRRMNALSRYALAAAKLALRDRGSERIEGSVGVALGTAFGPVQTSVDYLTEYVQKGAGLAPPQLFAESVANAPGSHIAIEHGLRGFNITVTQRESSAFAAAMVGASQLLKEAADAALIGGVEELNEMLFSILDRVGALAHDDGEASEECRPFDARRNGLVAGEGSAILIVERHPAAGAYGYLSGFGIARDTTAGISDWGTNHHSVVTAMRAAIDDARLQPADIDAVYASANSNRRADRLEYCALQTLFGDRVPPVVAAKGYFGEYAAAGALQLAAALVAMRDQVLHATPGFERGDPEMRLSVNTTRCAAELRHILVNSLSAGGGIVCAVISREGA